MSRQGGQITESLHVGQLADWCLAAKAQGGAPAYTPLDPRSADVRNTLPAVEGGRIDARLNLCLTEINTAITKYEKAAAEIQTDS